MKKLLVMVMVVLMLASVQLIGCGKNEENLNVKEVGSQISALTQVKAGQADVAVIDATMAGYLINSDSDFSDLAIVNINYQFVKEYYAVAGKKGNSDLINFVNNGIKLACEGDIYSSLLEKYGLTDRANPLTKNYTYSENWKDQLQDKSKVVIGYTINAPMGIEKDDGSVTGFDIDLAIAVFDGSGVTVEPKLIEWGSKVVDLNSGRIDLIWNGLTADQDRSQTMELSDYYLVNEQAVVVKAKNKDLYKSVEDLKGKSIAVEQDSAGYNAAMQIKNQFEKQ